MLCSCGISASRGIYNVMIDNNTACDDGQFLPMPCYCGDQGPSQCALDVVDGWAPHIIISYCGASRGTMMNAEHSGWIGRYVQYHGVSCRSTENDHHSFWFSFAGGAYQICKFRTHLSSLSPLRMGLQQHQSSTTTPQQHQSSTITTSILFSLQYYSSSNNNNYYHDQCEFPQLVSTMVIWSS